MERLTERKDLPANGWIRMPPRCVASSRPLLLRHCRIFSRRVAFLPDATTDPDESILMVTSTFLRSEVSFRALLLDRAEKHGDASDVRRPNVTAGLCSWATTSDKRITLFSVPPDTNVEFANSTLPSGKQPKKLKAAAERGTQSSQEESQVQLYW